MAAPGAQGTALRCLQHGLCSQLGGGNLMCRGFADEPMRSPRHYSATWTFTRGGPPAQHDRP